MKTKQYRAAGGVIIDRNYRVLLMERDVEREGEMIHEVRLPKGHVEAGETDRDAALREVCEESGFCELDVIADLGTVQTEYEFRGTHYVRDEHYFMMKLESLKNRGQHPHVKKEEALFENTWAADLDEARRRLTYESEQEFARRAQVALEHRDDHG